MKYTAQDIEKVLEYASYLMNLSDIAVLLNFNEDEFRNCIGMKTHELSIAYHKGKVQTMLELHQGDLQAAKLGSPASLEQTRKYMLDQQTNENG